MKLTRFAAPAGALSGCLLLTACGGGLSGTYGGEECLYTLEFEGDEEVYITTLGTDAGTYRVDGDRVIVTASDGQSIVFTQNDGNLESSFFGETMICEKQ